MGIQFFKPAVTVKLVSPRSGEVATVQVLRDAAGSQVVESHYEPTLPAASRIGSTAKVFPFNATKVSTVDRMDPTILTELEKLRTEIQSQLTFQLALARQMAQWWSDPALKNWKDYFGYPDPVNIADMRIHAFITVTLLTVGLVLDTQLDQPIGCLVIHVFTVVGFLNRALFGPRFDLQGQFVQLWLRNILVDKFGLLDNYFQPGPPQRLNVIIAFAMGSLALLFRWAIVPSVPQVGNWLWGVLIAVFLCMASFRVCAGCGAVYVLMRLGLFPKNWCEKCYINYEVAVDRLDRVAQHEEPLLVKPKAGAS